MVALCDMLLLAAGTGLDCKRSVHNTNVMELDMGNLLHWAIVFLVVALVAALLGFGGVAGVATQGATLLFWVAIILFVVSLVASLARR